MDALKALSSQQQWWHATTVADWYARVSCAPDAWVHVGTLDAAYMRAQRVTRTGLQVLETHNLWLVTIPFHTLRIHADVIIDHDENWESLDTQNVDGYVYMNDHEDAGSYSLYVRGRCIHALLYGEISPS